MKKNREELVMEVQLTVVDHLGINMYTSLPPVISEIVANSYDADATKVEIFIPETEITEDSVIEIRDNGSGMAYDELNSAYLKIGRNRRSDLGNDESTVFHRKIIGRKGLGKLSVFGVAKKVEIQSIKDGNKIIFEMDIDDIKRSPNGKYKPILLCDERTTQENGVTVTLKKLKRKQKISLPIIRRGLAQRFSVISAAFDVIVNEISLTTEERNLRANVEYLQNFDNIEIKENSGWRVTGWIGTLPNTVRGDIDRGIIVLTRGKLVQEPTLFGVTGGKELAYSYMVGELHADFLDDQNDLIATYRSSIVWESEEGLALKTWIQKSITDFSYEWARKRILERTRVITEDPELKRWLGSLSPHEKKVANKVIRAITADETLAKERVLELATYMRSSFEIQTFRDLAAEINETPNEDDTKLLNLFYEWQFIETREMLKVFEGRLKTIEKFQSFIDTNAREVPTIHRFLKEFPWVLEARWTDLQDEVTYSQLLRDRFPETDLDEPNRRIDFICTGFNDTIHVVELKRPHHRIGKKDLDQIRDYVIFIQSQLGTDPDGYKTAAGYLVCGEIQESQAVRTLIEMNENSRIYVRKYGQLLQRAKALHKEFIDKYEDLKLSRQQTLVEE
jgi:hypothetical protein